MEKTLKNIEWVIVAILTIIFISISILVVLDKLTNFDNAIYNIINKINMEKYFRYVTEFGDAFVFLIVILFVFSITKSKKHTVLLTLNIAGIGLINYILKIIFTRQRPVGISSIVESGFSFPSGHSSVSAAFYIYLAYLIIKNVNRKWIKWIIIPFFALFILSIGISRIYLGVHFVSDVVAGLSLGSIYTILFIHFTRNIKFLETKSK